MNTWIKGAVFAVAIASLPAIAQARSYVYYDHDIYYAPYSHTYYWREDGRWRSGHRLDRHYREYVRRGGFTIDLDTDRPYDRHDYVVERYHDWRHRHHYDHD